MPIITVETAEWKRTFYVNLLFMNKYWLPIMWSLVKGILEYEGQILQSERNTINILARESSTYR